ncbi:MAG: glycosyltransferase [Hydrogenothermaceae bacterium]
MNINSFILAFFVSMVVNFLIIKYFDHIFHDPVKGGTQKFHTKPTPRAGGLGIFIGVLTAGIVIYFKNPALVLDYYKILGASLFTFLAGIMEDITKKVSVKQRFLFMGFSAVVSVFLCGAIINRVDIPWLDNLFSIYPFAFIFTIFAIVGLTNAINIIDGFNGLASGVSIMILLAIGYVAYKNNDLLVMIFSIVIIGSILGFFVFNYPSGLVFLGDGGAYFIGFMIGILSILLVKNNPQVSPWFAVLVSIYPIYETLFSIYRKKFLRKVSPTEPDGLHLHMLFYKTVAKKLLGTINPIYRNPATSPLIWILNTFGTIPAVLFWDNTQVLIFFSFVFAIVYTYIYFSIIKSKLPKQNN